MYDLQEMKKRIKDIKQSVGLTNLELAKRANIPVGTLNKMLGSETKDPQISTVIKIAKALGVSADYLILGSKQHNITSEIAAKYEKLNPTGKLKVDEYIEDLLANSKYTINNSMQLKPPEHTISDFDTAIDVTDIAMAHIKTNKV